MSRKSVPFLAHSELTDCIYIIDGNDKYEVTEQCIKAMKATNRIPRWIPVSERLPEEREWMGTKRFGTTISDEVYVTLETPDGERFTEHLSFQNGRLSQADQERMRACFKGAVPIAWMPLPLPWKGERGLECL